MDPRHTSALEGLVGVAEWAIDHGGNKEAITPIITAARAEYAASTIALLRKIDWGLLRKQKEWLLTQPVCDEREGIVNLLDALQDYAVDNGGLSEETVFGFKKKGGKKH